MKILVTGGSGFLGSALAVSLAASGHSVTLPLRALSDNPNLSHALIQQVKVGAIENMTLSDWQPLLVGIETVIHSAAIAHIGIAVPETHYRAVNATASATLAEACARSGVATFIFVSSIRAQVGATSALVQTEATPPAPSEAYGRSKLEAERLIMAAFPKATIFRPALIVGAQPKANLASLVRLADTPLPLPFGGLSAPQAMVALDHLVQAIMLVLSTPAMRGQTYVVADDPHPSLADMIAFLREALGRPRRLVSLPPALLALPLRIMGKANIAERLTGGLQVDASKLKAAGWQPQGSPADTFRALGRGSLKA